jgi:hypothetical protein
MSKNFPNMNLPLYTCHKQVRAAKIMSIRPLQEDYTQALQLELGTNVPSDLTVDIEWVQKHRPQAGGYLIQYADGYTSYSPAAPFEEGYTRAHTEEEGGAA